MRTVALVQPRRVTFGSHCLAQAIEYLEALTTQGIVRIHLIASPSQAANASVIVARLEAGGFAATADCSIAAEPTVEVFETARRMAREANAQCIVGMGGGSPLDVAKLVAAFADNPQRIEEAFGIGLLLGRSCHLVCVPTTSGTGSEVSPNAILLDESSSLKKAVISPFLVPDAAFIDPALTLTLPPAATAATGLDALTHCIEAYTNRFAHPLVDVYAREGIELCGRSLLRAVTHPGDLEAREAMSLASLYGGLCLGPVNTAAVHALAYPLGAEFRIAHGLSNAILLPHVFRFNAQETPNRHAEVARFLGVSREGDDREVSAAGGERLSALARDCGVSSDLKDYGLTREHIPRLAESAMTVTRLLRNNPRGVGYADCVALYERCFP